MSVMCVRATCLSRRTYERWLVEDTGVACGCTLAQRLFSSRGAWVTNSHSACVARAVEWALWVLTLEGTIEQLRERWIVPAHCAHVDDDVDGDLSVVDLADFAGVCVQGPVPFATWPLP